MNLGDWRSRIDDLDDRILNLLNQRAEAALRIGDLKRRQDAPGRPFLFETTREFQVAFGLRDLDDLPKVEGDLVLPDLAVSGASADAAEPGDGQAQTEQDPGPGGPDVPAGR